MRSRSQAQCWDQPEVSGPINSVIEACCELLPPPPPSQPQVPIAWPVADLRLILLSLQTRVTMGVPALMASTRPSVTACLASRVPSARKTSTSVPAIPAETVPTAPTVWTATRAPVPRASTASTVRTTHLTVLRGGSQPQVRQRTSGWWREDTKSLQHNISSGCRAQTQWAFNTN